MSAGFKTDTILRDASGEQIKKAIKHCNPRAVKVSGKMGAETIHFEVYAQHNGRNTTHLYQDEIADMKNCAKLLTKKEDTKKRLQYSLLLKKIETLKDQTTMDSGAFNELCDIAEKALPKGVRLDEFFEHFGIGFTLGDA
jgi:hypothetical protein